MLGQFCTPYRVVTHTCTHSFVGISIPITQYGIEFNEEQMVVKGLTQANAEALAVLLNGAFNQGRAKHHLDLLNLQREALEAVLTQLKDTDTTRADTNDHEKLH